MKWRIVSVSLLLLTMGLLASVLMQSISARQPVLTSELAGQNLQLGFYDLLSHQREVYNARFTLQGKRTLMTVTSPDNSQLLVKMNLQQIGHEAAGGIFDVQALYGPGGQGGEMLRSILAPEGHHRVWFGTFTAGEERLLILPSGQLVYFTAG